MERLHRKYSLSIFGSGGSLLSFIVFEGILGMLECVRKSIQF